MKYYIAIDIGGTTFNSGLFSNSLEQIDITQKDKIRYHSGKEEVVAAIIKQVLALLEKNNINKEDVLGLGVASPGPLDVNKGKILDTINLTIFQHYNLTEDFSKRLNEAGIKSDFINGLRVTDQKSISIVEEVLNIFNGEAKNIYQKL